MSKFARKLVTCMGVLGVLVGAGVCFAQEKAAQPETAVAAKPAKVELPAVVADAVKAAFPEMKIGEVRTREIMRGTKVFIVALEKGDLKKEATVTEAGVVMSVSTPIKVAELPKAVADAVAKAAEGAAIAQASKIETLVGRGMAKLEKPRVGFTVVLTKDGKTAQARVSEDGANVRVGEWKEQAPETKKPAEKPATPEAVK